jgi:hypothetical protein
MIADTTIIISIPIATTRIGSTVTCQNVQSIARVAGGAFGFLTLIQVSTGPIIGVLLVFDKLA